MKQSFSIDSSPKKHVLDSIIHTKVTETLTVRGPALAGLLAELRGKGAKILTFAVTGQNHYEVTFQRNNFSRINAGSTNRKI